uniref:Ankyrin repeat and SOCS box containing 15b n=1 Tax=Amphiprion percula TaxID=161767 RepID=A0A3P8TP06_AMPPE
MDDVEQEGIDEDLIEFAIRESIQDAYKLPSLSVNITFPCVCLGCVSTGDVDALQELSGCVSAFREIDGRGWTPLHAAAVQPRPEILHVVLQGERTEEGDTALTLAAEANRVEGVRMLLQHGASPHNTNGRNESPLLVAAKVNSASLTLNIQAKIAFFCLFFAIFSQFFSLACCLLDQVGCPAILMLLLRHGAKVTSRDGHGVTPLGIAADHGNAEKLFGKHYTVLYDASGSGNLDCIKLLLQHGANPNVASYACQLPIHRAAYEGHILALRTLIPITTKRAIRLSGQSPVHSAADGGQVECLELLIQKGFDVNALLDTHISGRKNYGDLRKSPLYFAVCNGDATCAEMLLAAGAKTDLDPLRCILVAIRAERYELVQLLLSYGAEVNCYFRVISNTVFPTALQYCLRDHVMLRLLLNSGYQAHKCFQCGHGNSEGMDSSWTDLHNQFCEFVSVSWLTHLVGSVVRMLLDYVSHISICSHLQRILERRPEWEEISEILSKPRSLQHLCRLVIRSRMSLKTLNDPEATTTFPFPPTLTKYLTYREYDLYSELSST